MGDGDGVGRARDGHAGRAGPGDGKTADLGLHHPVEGDRVGISGRVEDGLLGAAAYQPHVAGHGQILGVEAGTDPDGVLRGLIREVQAGQLGGGGGQRVRDGIKGVHTPGQPVVGAELTVVGGGVEGGPPLLHIADINPITGARRRRIGGVAGVDDR